MMQFVKLVEYECVAPEHQTGAAHPDKLTIHERQWAFCPYDTHADGHVWKRVGDDELEELQRRVGVAIARSSERVAAS
jgi:hypothetical protein